MSLPSKILSSQFTEDLVPNIVDKRAVLTPNVIYSEYPISTLTYEEGYRKITYKDFANAINGVARWLVDTLGPGKNFETLAYVGPNDIRYPALILGAVKAGYKLFLTSPRNSLAAHFHLFDTLGCKTLLSSSPRPAIVNSITAHRAFSIVEVPNVSHLLDVQHQHFEFDKSWLEAQLEPLFVVHTSGSTGMPKPLLYTHASAAANMKMISLPPPSGYKSQDRMFQGKRVFITFPPFHGAYVVSHLFNAIPFGTVMIAPTSGAIPSGEGLVQGLKQSHADVAFLVPSIVQDLAHNLELLEYCSTHLEAIMYCGGDLPLAIGDVVASKTTLLNQFGASELGLTPQIISLTDRGPEDWKYAQFHPDLGLELRHISDGIHELYAVRDPGREHVQPTFTIFPQIEEYASRDLFVRHPTKHKSDLWSWQARADDIIVFLNGEKTNPISMEQTIVAQNKDVKGALVVGAQRFQAALLIEPVNDGRELDITERAAFIERIWPSIESANKDAPSHSRIMKSHILFAQPQNPMLRAGKGTISRAATLKSYSAEIDALYKDADALPTDFHDGAGKQKGNLDENAVAEIVKDGVLSTVEWSDVSESTNFFDTGMDSLQALTIVRKLRQGLCTSTIALSTVYTNPSLPRLTAAIVRLLDERQTLSVSQEQNRLKKRTEMIEEYKQMTDKCLLPKANGIPKQRREVVVLTGSTGTLGSYLLNVLLHNPAVTHVYCLNRTDDSSSRQVEKNRNLGLPNHSNDERISYIKVDLGLERLNLSKVQYDEIVSEVTLVIHNAWSVNFNLSLDSFRPQLHGLVNLLALVRDSAQSARLFYVSSISSTMLYRSESKKTPEKVITADVAPASNGYAESKYVAEHIIQYAAQNLLFGPSLAFARVGQLAGATNHVGLWNKDEWFPSMILSSVQIGALPESLGPMFDVIDWVPIDLVADILVELAFERSQSDSTAGNLGARDADIYHTLNPRTCSWAVLRTVVIEELRSNANKSVDLVPLHWWITRVRKETEALVGSGKGSGSVDLETALRLNPAAKLLDFFEDLASSENTSTNRLELSKTLETSKKLRELEPIKDEWMRKWIREWFTPTTKNTPYQLQQETS